MDVTVPETGVDAGTDATDAAVSGMVTTTPIDFGTAGCGSAPSPASKSYSLENTGPVPVTYSATTNSIFTIQGASSGTVAPGATGTITVVAGTVPSTTTAGTVISGALFITTNIPGFTSVMVPLTVTAQGGSLVVTTTVVGFGTQQINTTSSPLPFSVQNVGNAPVSVTFGAPTDSEFSISASGSIAPGATLANASATFSPTSAGAKTATAAVQASGALCATPPNLAVSLSGTGGLASVNIGPSPLNFSAVPCGQTAAAQQVTITNGYTTPITYTAALGLAPSPYAISSKGGSIPGNGQVVITVTPNAIPAQVDLSPTGPSFNDTLTISTSAPGTTPVVIPLQETASGAILALNMANTNFGETSTAATLPFTVVNTGNLAASVSVGTAGSNSFSAALSGNTVAPAGGTDPGTATFAPAANGTITSTLSLSASTPLCAPLPAGITLTATGAFPLVNSPATVAVTATCGIVASDGTQAAAVGTQASITLTNGGLAEASYSVTGTTKNFTVVSGASGNISSGSSATIVIVGKVPAGATGGNTVNGTLTYTTNEPVNNTHTVKVTDAITGANLLVQPVTLAVTTCNPTGYQIVNTGNNDPILQPVTVIGASGYCSGEGCSGSNYGFESNCVEGCGLGAFLTAVQIDPGAGNAVQDDAYSNLDDFDGGICDTLNPVITYAPTGPVCVGTNIGADVLSLSLTFSGSACICGD